jgi:tRNA-dihydrouridine synthase C
MEGVMTPLFCQAFHELNLTNGWLTPYYRVTSNVPKDARLKKIIRPYMQNNLPVIVQLMGTDPLMLTKVAERMTALRAKGINLNFACPSKQVIKSGAGGALLKNIPLMLEIINSIKKALPEISLSVKLRSGFADWRESEKIIPALVGTNSLDFIGVHFRTVKENYLPILGKIERFKHFLALAGEIPLIASGDIFSEKDARNILRLGYAGAMLARGILSNPFLISNLQETEKSKLPLEASRQCFFKNLQKIAQFDENLYRRAKFIEYVGMIWGRNSKQFSIIKQLNDKELLDFEF